jgi:predicted O-methyltransferase YrrM
VFWRNLFTHLDWIGKPNLRFLEIGCFEGRSTVWFLEHVLTDPTSSIDVIDTFEGSPEHARLTPDALTAGLYETFTANTAPYADKVSVHQSTSFDRLVSLAKWHDPFDAFDFVYLDGSHRASDVLTDAVLAWTLIRPGGVLLFDDTNWKYTVPETGEVLEPKRGIDAFRVAFAGQFELLADGAQVAIRKR